MARAIRASYRNNIVIVCEGSDTEPFYLQDLKHYLKGRFDDVRIVPCNGEAKSAMSRDKALKSSRKTRTTNPPNGNKSGKFYWVMEEDDLDSYKQFNQQPIRYVREAQLFLRQGYTEAWAVYDHDKFPDHATARMLADSDPALNIAFSSISFEEWLILHFERNPKAFQCSCCKDNKKDRGCGDKRSCHPMDCHGEKCLAGYLRERNYISDFTKSHPDLFSKYSKDRLDIARINAAWVRSLGDKTLPVFERNPYTDFDKLIERLLGLKDHYHWIGEHTIAQIGKVEISISRDRESHNLSIINNAENKTLLSHWWIIDSKGNAVSTTIRFVLSPQETLNVTCPPDCLLCIGDDIDKYIITL